MHVTWIDSDSMHGWNKKWNIEHMAESDLHVCDTVGILCPSPKDRVIVIQSVGEDTVGEVMRIPRFAVKNVVVLGHVEVDIS